MGEGRNIGEIDGIGRREKYWKNRWEKGGILEKNMGLGEGRNIGRIDGRREEYWRKIWVWEKGGILEE